MHSPITRRAAVIRWGLVISGVLFIGGLIWVLRGDGLPAAVESRGGEYYAFSSNSVATRFLARLMGQSTTMHWVFFYNGGVDDNWIGTHATELNRRSNLMLTLRDPDITDDGLAAITASDVFLLDLQGSQITDKSLATRAPVMYLNVAHTRVTDAGLAALPRFPQSLTIDRRQVTPNSVAAMTTRASFQSLYLLDADDAAVAQLAQVPVNHELLIFGNDVTSASLPILQQIPGLSRLTLVDVNLTPADIDTLQQKLTGCTVSAMTQSEFERQERHTPRASALQ